MVDGAKPERLELWQTLADYASSLFVFESFERDFSNRLRQCLCDRRDYALRAVTSDGIDTVGVCGSNPHAATIFH